MPTWNKEQLKAIQTKNKNILVSASAGAGKTTVLIARLVDLVLKDRIAIDHILAMTFTEAAANEMKKRLAKELSDVLNKTEDANERIYIAEQLSAISSAHISTIHSFCLSILQEFYYVIGLSAKRVKTIMDTATSVKASTDAMRQVFIKQYTKQDDAFYQTCLMFSTRAENDEQLRSAISSLATSANAQSDPDAWLETCRSSYQRYSSIQDLPDALKNSFFDDLLVQTKIYQEDIQSIYALYQTTYCEETKKANLVKKKLDALPTLFKPLQMYKYTTYKDAFIAQCHVVVPPSPNKDDKSYTTLRKRILAFEDTMLANLYDESIMLKDLHSLTPIVHKLIEMCKDYRSNFAKIKETQECIDFDDMEHFALAILQANDGQVAKHYQALFDEIMVDEFQDSNDVQNTLVTLIARERNVFRVGDIKQSIYGFRHAKPQLMRSLIEQRTPQDEIIYLSNNYRSKKMIVDFNNALFKELMNLDGFDGSYQKEDDVETGIPAQLEDNYPIVFHALHVATMKEDNDCILSNNELKASYIANQIIAIKEKEHRKWKDFVVLVRANARKEDMKQVFDEVGIPYFIDVKSGFYQSNAVQVILSTLKALVNPHSEISYTACMMSPLFQIDVQEFTTMHLTKEKDEDVYHYMKRIQHPQYLQFEELRKRLYQIGICEMLTNLYELQSYYSYHTTVQERTNLDLLFDNAANFENSEGKGIIAFVKSMEAIQNVQSAEAIPIGSEEDVVRVMSIHQSKGLQFPVVFLWSNSRQTPIEFKELFVCDSDLGIGLKHMDTQHRYVRSTIFRKAIEHKKDREELEEEMRILYVATTRAQQQMHIVDCVKSLDIYDQTMSTASIYQRGGYTSWVLTSALKHNLSLFGIQSVTELWKTQPQSVTQKAYRQLPIYTDKEPALAFSSPSSQKQTTLPSLSFKQDASMRHGSMLHKMIEEQHLSNETNIKLQYPNIEEDDFQALQELSKNDLYSKACTYPEVYYELPFMIKVDNEIQHGFMDFVAINDTEIILIDFKSDRMHDTSVLLKNYKDQILAYTQALEVMYPNKAIHAYLYSLSMHIDIRVDTAILG